MARKKKQKEPEYPVNVPLYELEAIGLENKRWFITNYETSQFYTTFEEALAAARKVADDHAWTENIPGLREEQTVFIVFIRCGRKYSEKKDSVYGFSKVVYGVSTGDKAMTEAVIPDPTIRNLRIDEYTEQPHLTKDMFYQWD